MMTTAAATARLLADAGIERVFGLPGGEVLVLMDELRTRRRRLRADASRVERRHRRGGVRQAARPAGRGVDDAGAGRGQPDAAVVQRVSRSGAAARDLGADPRRVSRQPYAPAAATARRLPAGRAVRGQDHRQQRRSMSCRARSRQCMERPFGASYLTLSAREALEPAVGAGGTARRSAFAAEHERLRGRTRASRRMRSPPRSRARSGRWS